MTEISSENASVEEVEAKTQSKPKATRAEKSGGGFWGVFLSLLALLAVAALAYFAWLLNEQQLADFQNLKQQVQQQGETRFDASALEAKIQALDEKPSIDTQQFDALQNRVLSQQKRLQSMSNTSRSDWKLAEAEYLLRLANQRMLVERSTSGAEALLESADKILLALDQQDLLAIREALRQEITALKVAGKVDRDGLYLSLSAAADQIDRLPLITAASADQDASDALPVQNTEENPSSASEAAPTNIETVRNSFFAALGSFSDYIRISHDNDALEPVLTPEYRFYIKQNARLMLERAQLAMVREETDIYQGSLAQAQVWLKKYYREGANKKILLEELARLQQQEIVQSLPDLTLSLSLLRDYIEDLHALNQEVPAPLAAEEK